ncbi:MAG: YaaL family protein [Lachnospiraceae bacterium]|nr:YaaL family protein [Lachnospiraceae bacterium]
MRKPKEKPITAQQRLLDDLHLTKNALDAAYSNFDNATDPDLIDSCTFEIYAAQKRYKFLLEQARSMNLQIFF